MPIVVHSTAAETLSHLVSVLAIHHAKPEVCQVWDAGGQERNRLH